MYLRINELAATLVLFFLGIRSRSLRNRLQVRRLEAQEFHPSAQGRLLRLGLGQAVSKTRKRGQSAPSIASAIAMFRQLSHGGIIESRRHARITSPEVLHLRGCARDSPNISRL